MQWPKREKKKEKATKRLGDFTLADGGGGRKVVLFSIKRERRRAGKEAGRHTHIQTHTYLLCKLDFEICKIPYVKHIYTEKSALLPFNKPTRYSSEPAPV